MTDSVDKQAEIQRLEQYVADVEQDLGPNSIEFAEALEKFAQALRVSGSRLDEAQAADERAHEVRRRLDANLAVNHPKGSSAEEKECPFCAELIKKEAIKCKHCGSMLNQPRQLAQKEKPVHSIASPAANVTQAGGQPITLVVSDKYTDTNCSPAFVALLNACCIAGIGHIVMGQIGKGIFLMFIHVLLALVTSGLSLIVTWPLLVIDSYCVASRLKRGEMVGRWQWF